MPSLVSRLSALHAVLDSRVALHDRLLALNGRLELVVAQIDLQREANAPVASTSTAKPKPKRPVLRYVEGDSDLEDAEAMPVDDQGEIEDIALAATPSALDEDDSIDEEDGGVGSEDFEAEEPRRTKANGFLDLEADEDGDSSEDSDLDSDEEDAELQRTAFAGFDEDEDADGDADAAIVDDEDDDSPSDDDA